jgi:diaminohydroxyphosphoribosylaminopyrimidine deaminase/5-amino-6-(5-phosphoribosylamino)uracil reductase
VDLEDALHFLAQKGINSVLCEGGAALAASLLSDKLVDEVHWIIAPKIIGDLEAKPGVAINHFIDLDDAIELSKFSFVRLGDDMLIHGFLSQATA